MRVSSPRVVEKAGNAEDIVRKVKSDLCGWSLGRVVMVEDTGFNSEGNRRILQRAWGHYIIGDRKLALLNWRVEASPDRISLEPGGMVETYVRHFIPKSAAPSTADRITLTVAFLIPPFSLSTGCPYNRGSRATRFCAACCAQSKTLWVSKVEVQTNCVQPKQP